MNEISVRIGEIKIASADQNIKAILGSCVGIALIWKNKNMKALAHCLLPYAPKDSQDFQYSHGKYVSSAVPKMLEMLNIPTNKLSELEVHLAGGANMLGQISKINRDHIGQQNAEAAIHFLKLYGLKIESTHLGGLQGRQIYIQQNGLVKITTFAELLEQK